MKHRSVFHQTAETLNINMQIKLANKMVFLTSDNTLDFLSHRLDNLRPVAIDNRSFDTTNKEQMCITHLETFYTLFNYENK
jgi:hypothetical protein